MNIEYKDIHNFEREELERLFFCFVQKYCGFTFWRSKKGDAYFIEAYPLVILNQYILLIIPYAIKRASHITVAMGGRKIVIKHKAPIITNENPVNLFIFLALSVSRV